MNKPFSWASNLSKLQRAKDLLGAEASEEAIKEKYVEFGGLVLPDYEIPEVSSEKPAKKPKK